MIFAIDFDGTLVEHAFPEIGEEVPMAFDTLKQLQAAGHRLILWTVRGGEALELAVQYCKERGIVFWGVNENPEQWKWSDSRKVYAEFYIDDLAIGSPLVPPTEIRPRPMVDWSLLRLYFYQNFLL